MVKDVIVIYRNMIHFWFSEIWNLIFRILKHQAKLFLKKLNQCRLRDTSSLRCKTRNGKVWNGLKWDGVDGLNNCYEILYFILDLCYYLCFMFVLLYYLVCSSQLCGHLLRKGWHLGSFVCGVFLCFVTFPYGVPGQVWYLIVSIPDLCFLLYLGKMPSPVCHGK